jgi:hypothetical protein
MDRQKRANGHQADIEFVDEDSASEAVGQHASRAAELTEIREKSAFVARQLLRALERLEPKDGVILTDKLLAFASVGELRDMVAYIFADIDA